jgi:hypothetical protein
MRDLVTCTRFSAETWRENELWRARRNWTGCAYGSPIEMSSAIPPYITIYVLELNITTNRIEGIGLVYNDPPVLVTDDPSNRIYSSRHYSRYTYRGRLRVDRSQFRCKERRLVRVLEGLVFKGKGHLKRGTGFTKLPDWITKNRHLGLLAQLRGIFSCRFCDSVPPTQNPQKEREAGAGPGKTAPRPPAGTDPVQVS